MMRFQRLTVPLCQITRPAFTMPLTSYSGFSNWLRNHAVAASLLVLLCSASPRGFLAWRADQGDLLNSIPDAGTYLLPAESLIERGAFAGRDGKPEVTRTPGYPAFLAVMLVLVGRNLRLALVAQAIVLSSGVVVLYWLARRILPPLIALAGGLLAAVSPWSAGLDGFPLSDGLFLLLLALILLSINLIEEVRNWGPLLFGGACIGLLTAIAVLVRPIWPLVILVAIALFLHYGPRRKEVWFLLMTMLFCAFTPLAVWQERNRREAHFDGLSDIAGITAWRYLASRVRAQVKGEDRWTVKNMAMVEENHWGLSVQEANDERWRRARAVFEKHPFVTLYCLVLSAAEHTVHPDPNVLTAAGLNFSGDYLTLALLWGGLLILAFLGWRCAPDTEWDDGFVDHSWLLTILMICLLLTVSSGISFGQGARLRAPLELIIPLLAAVGLVRLIRAFKRVQIGSFQESSEPVLVFQRPVLAVLIPVYNEVHTIEALIKKVLTSPVNMELRLFVVDDCSSDGSGAILDRLAEADPRITVLHHSTNRGKGAAIRTAIKAAQGDFAIIQDADFEYDPRDYQRIVAPLLRGTAEAVFGSRYLNGSERQVFRYWHSLGNSMLTTFFNIVHNIHLTDMETCYKAMPLKLLKSLRLATDRFGIEPEIAARLIALRARIIEVPIRYNPRSYKQGKKIGWRDAIEALYLILRFKYFDTSPCVDAGMVRHLAMAEAPRYQQATAAEIDPFLGHRVLEAGAGIGNLSIHLAASRELILTEPTADYRRQLVASLGYLSNVLISDRDVFSDDGATWAKSVRPDTILCINQLEHIEDDGGALSCLAQAIEPGGNLIILVPCHEFLYGSLDKALKRRRRYSPKAFLAMVGEAGLQIEHQKSLGKVILVGWLLESKVLRRQFFGSKTLILVNILSRSMKALDAVLPWQGLSLLVVARKPLRPAL